MAFRDSDKSTPKPFSDKKPDNFIQEKPFLDSNLENKVWDDISRLGGKQIAREEIDLIYRAFAEKISSISSDIEDLKSTSKSYSQESIEQATGIVEKSEDLIENEKEESEKIETSFSSLNDLENVIKVDENLDKQKIEIDEKILANIYEKIVKTISSPSILIPFIAKISEKIYDSITQASSKTFHALNREFRDQMKIDILGDIKDIARAKSIETIAINGEDEKAIRHLAEEAKQRKEQEKKNTDSLKDEKLNKTIVKNSKTIETSEIEKIEDVRRSFKTESENDSIETITRDYISRNTPQQENEIEKLEDARRSLKRESDSTETITRDSSSRNTPQQENEDQIVKKSFNSIREALIATQESLDESNQRIKRIWDETLKMNDLEEYSITSDNDDDESKQSKEDKKTNGDSREENESNIGRFALLGALAACYFLFKYQNSQSAIQRYLESNPPIESIQKDIDDTVEFGFEEIESTVQKEIDKNTRENGSTQQERQESLEDQQIIENEETDPEVEKRIEEYGKTVSDASVNDYEESIIEEESINAKKIERQLYDSSKESQEQLDEFLNNHRLKNTALDKEIQRRQKEAREAGEEFQLKLEKLQQDSKNAERNVREYIDEGEKERKYDKSITDSASGLIATELDIINSQDEIIKDHEQFEKDMVENEKKKDAQTRKSINDSFEEVQDEIIANQKNLEEQLKNDPKVAEKLKKAKRQTFREIERSGIEITDFIDKEFTRISNDVLKYSNLLKDENEVIEAATTNNKYVIIDMDSYQKMLMCVLEIGRDSLNCDNQVTAKIGVPQLR